MYPYYQNQQIVKVNGANGAQAFQMMPNSSALLLDESAPIVWLVQTDGAGYKTTTPYKIEPYKPEPEPDLNDILQRLKKLEEQANEKSNLTSNKRKSAEEQ